MPRCVSKDFCRKGVHRKVASQILTQTNADYGTNNVDVDVRSPENQFEDNIFTEGDEQVNCGDNYQGLLNDLKNAPDNVIQFLSASCLSRLSQQEYLRFLSVHDDQFEAKVQNLWNIRRNLYTSNYYCNSCGKKCVKNENCCGPIVKFVRIGVMMQLEDIVIHYLEDIMKIRENLKKGTLPDHNLSAPFFEKRWKIEKKNELLISGILSIDGISIPGNTRKLWPISIMLLDLPTSNMQQSCNILLEGITESTVNPSTQLWNAILPLVLSDCESSVRRVNDYVIRLKIVTSSSDQPAKRAIFGFKSHQSSHSCFYCLAPGTFYKTEGQARYDVRPGYLTLDDSRKGVNGFSHTPAKILDIILPYHTPIDILHNLGEGIYTVIMNELLMSRGTQKKSDLFSVDKSQLETACSEVVLPSNYSNIKKLRNGSDKISFFRLTLGSVAVTSDVISPKARFVIIALAMLSNRMYSNQTCPVIFDEQLCASSRWFLKEASEEYFSSKAHETLYHLPYVNRVFGSVAPLSTFSFEASYQYSFMGYSTRLTRNFCETASTRVLLHNTLRRELMKRAKNSSSPRLRMFLSATSGIQPTSVTYGNEINISRLHASDLVDRQDTASIYSSLTLPCGKLRSEYYDWNTHDDVFFYQNMDSSSSCYRFILVLVDANEVRILAEPLLELPAQNSFNSLRNALNDLSGTDYYFASEVIRMIENYDGVKSCKLSGNRTMIRLECIKSVGSYVVCPEGYFVTSINGNPVHN